MGTKTEIKTMVVATTAKATRDLDRLSRSNLEVTVHDDAITLRKPFAHLDQPRFACPDADLTTLGGQTLVTLHDDLNEVILTLVKDRGLRYHQSVARIHQQLDLHQQPGLERAFRVGDECADQNRSGDRVDATVDPAHDSLENPIAVSAGARLVE